MSRPDSWDASTTAHFLPESELSAFIGNLLTSTRVVGPVARPIAGKKDRFVYDELRSATDLRLDHDITLLPPKKILFPPRQDLVRFGPKGFESCIAPLETILMGVHPYDLRAIEMLDQVFAGGIADDNYLANRNATILIGSSVQRHSERSFFGSVVDTRELRGHDGFLTRIQGGYLFETHSSRARKLVEQGAFVRASEEQRTEGSEVNEKQERSCPESLKSDAKTIAPRVRAAFKNESLWGELSEKCFSCGSCIIVCPTCYCFDVQDEWNIDQESGTRFRSWDGCMLHDFAKVSLGAGGSENFRERKAQRYRHRIMRKFAYQNQTLGGPACVGCGRCSTSCVPDIASPTRAVERILNGPFEPTEGLR